MFPEVICSINLLYYISNIIALYCVALTYSPSHCFCR